MNQSIPGVQTGARAPASTAYYPKGVDWAMDLSGRPLTELLDDAARDFPAKAAIVFKGKTTTYRELADAVDVRPAVEAARNDVIQFAGREIIAQPVPAVIGRVEFAVPGRPVEDDAVA